MSAQCYEAFMSSKSHLYRDDIPLFAVAPMMDWTDRHCRFLHRQLSKKALLYTEMVVTEAILHGDLERLLGYNESVEHPIAVQIGGSDPDRLAMAAEHCAKFKYDEINLNVGCPSDRVQSGTFGACLMREPELVSACIAKIKSVTDIPVTVKCRIGVDEQDTQIALDDMTSALMDAKVDALWVHARKAWLKGLSPKENRDVPPLDYDRVYRLKAANPHLFIGINGGIEDLAQSKEHLKHVDGVMLGRVAYQNSGILTDVDRLIYGDDADGIDWQAVCEAMILYAEKHIKQGGRLVHVSRHMVGLFHGKPQSRRFRQILSTDAVKSDDAADVFQRAFDAVLTPVVAAE
jgi:tRNA-dihydrouridine synthase A